MYLESMRRGKEESENRTKEIFEEIQQKKLVRLKKDITYRFKKLNEFNAG